MSNVENIINNLKFISNNKTIDNTILFEKVIDDLSIYVHKSLPCFNFIESHDIFDLLKDNQDLVIPFLKIQSNLLKEDSLNNKSIVGRYISKSAVALILDLPGYPIAGDPTLEDKNIVSDLKRKYINEMIHKFSKIQVIYDFFDGHLYKKYEKLFYFIPDSAIYQIHIITRMYNVRNNIDV